MREKTYSNLVKKLATNNSIFEAQIALTYRCNLDCIHCFESKDTANELTLFEIKNIMSQLKEMNCLTLSFTGGEIFLREDILEIFEFSRQIGFGIKILTNGTLLREKLVKQIKKFNPVLIQISLYGASQKVHETITRIKGSSQATLNAISLLKEYNFRFSVATVAMQQNFQEIKTLRGLAKRENWDLLTDYCITPKYDGSPAPLDCRLSQSQIRQTTFELKSEGKVCKKTSTAKSNAYFYYLPLGQKACYISAQGKVFPHCTLRIKIGDLREKSFKEIWESSQQIKNLRGLKLSDFHCSSCRHSLYCWWDPGLAWLEQGDLLASSDWLCKLTKSGLRRDGKAFSYALQKNC